MGDSAAALDFIADGIEWHIVGDLTIDGNAAVKEMCEEAASQGKANFQNGRVKSIGFLDLSSFMGLNPFTQSLFN